MADERIRLSTRRELRREPGAVRGGLLAITCASLCACSTMVGPIPRAGAVHEADGFKMLRPGASATACGADLPAGSGLVAAAIGDLLASDPEADTILNVVVSIRRSPFASDCVTVTGDVVRATSTVVLPMLGGHDHHMHHGGDSR